MNELEKIYLDILNEQSSPTSFTPEELLYDIRKNIFFSRGSYCFYTVEDLENFADETNKELFKVLVNHMKDRNDFGMMLIYFMSVDDIEEIILKSGHSYPPMPYKNVPKNFSMNAAFNQLKKYFNDKDTNGANFNSIDVCPELGCIIAINGAQLSSNRDFEQVLDHEINHYFEGLNVHFNLADNVDNIVDAKDHEIIDKLEKFYNMDFSSKDGFVQDIKTHFFNYVEFRSMSANVFHEILRYNETHLTQLDYDDLIDDIVECNYGKYERPLSEYILFCWICRKMSSSRWEILLKGIKAACEIKKNIFQKFFIKGKDIFRNMLMKL